jgi:Rrf2 family transcriptional regulator, cysteine metabolism repressor
MKLSTKSEYAFLALISCSTAYRLDRRVKIEEIVSEWNIPRKYLEHILTSLKHAGYIKTKRGAAGGLQLARDPSSITLAEIVRLMDGALAPILSVSTYFYEKTPLEQSKEFVVFFREIRDYLSNKLETTTIADLIPD